MLKISESFTGATPVQRLGPCRLIERLGNGAFGTVYLARLEENRPFGRIGDRLAVKVLRRTSKASDLARFFREAEIGGSVQHPAVVRTHCSGREDLADRSLYYLVMEYVEGRTMRQVMDQFGAIPESLLQALAIQITAALDAVHRAGAIHRDLKPTNILLTADYRVKLSDLGIAHIAGDGSSLTGSGMFLGTFNYSAPEQLQGRRPTPATDLYALGVVLYEAATGTQPFRGANLEATILRHLHETPPKVSAIRPEISPFFEAVIDHLLEKSPERRFQTARELLEVLREGEASLWWLSRDKVVRAPGPRRRAFWWHAADQELAFVGREEPLKQLMTAWRRCLDGHGQLVLVTGEAGIGKSRLLEELGHRLEQGGKHFLLYGSGSPGSRPGAGALARALVAHLGDDDLETQLAEVLPQDAQLLARLVAYLRDLPAQPDTGPLPQETIQSLFHQVLRSLAAQRPVAWMVDDLHFASAETQVLLASMAQVACNLPCLLIATGRPGSTAGLVKALHSRIVPQRVELGPLHAGAVERLLERSLPAAEWFRFGRHVARRSDGNPLFLTEMIREARSATLDEEYDSNPVDTWLNDIPTSLKELLEDRLDELDDIDRALLQCGAVEGFEFTPELLARVRGTNPLEVLERLAAIERRRGLIQSTERGFRFTHHLLQEVVYAGLPKPLRRHYHHSLATALAESNADSSARGEVAVALCEHFLKGGQGHKGLPFVRAALEHLAQRHDAMNLLKLSDLTLEATPEDDTALRIDVLLHQTECHYLLGQRDDEARTVETALSLATGTADASRTVRARLLQGRLLVDSGPRGLSLLEKVLDEVRAVSDASTEARILGQLGQAHLRSGRFKRSLEFYRRQLKLSLDLSEPEGAAEARCSIAEALLGLHRAADAKESLLQCITQCDALELSSLRARAYQAFALTLHSLAEYPKARTFYEKSLELSRDLGYLEMEIGALGNYSNLCLIEGNVELAETLHARRKVLSQARSTPFLDAYLHLESADLFRVRRDFERSREAYQAALDRFTEIGAHYGEAEAWIGMGRAAYQTAERSHARHCFRQAVDLCERAAIHGLVPLVEAYRAALGDHDPRRVRSLDTLPLPERGEGYWLLGVALDSRDHLEIALRLLLELSAHLDGEAQQRFWKHHPVARAVNST
ncbi:MAG: protein kinase [Acidobacteriota bacterium]